jgi:hypothetical protein
VVKDRVVVCSTSRCYENAGASGENIMFVMFAYVSLSPARNEIFAGLVDCDTSLGEATHFGKTFGCHMVFFENHIAANIFILKPISPIFSS